MKSTTAIAAMTLLVAAAVGANAQGRVTVIGCPAHGAVANCLVIRGTDNITYNISEAKQRPEIGQRAISLTGTPVKKASPCLQGVVLTNIAWTYTNQACR